MKINIALRMSGPQCFPEATPLRGECQLVKKKKKKKKNIHTYIHTYIHTIFHTNIHTYVCMNEEERDYYLANMRNRIQQHRNNMNAVHHIHYNIGEMNVICPDCAALRFGGESFYCCHNGKVALPNSLEYPPELKRLFDMNDHKGTNFRKYIRNYNSAFAFASFGANINHSPGRRPYCFRLHGQTYHHVSSLHPGDNDARKYRQLYIIDAQEAVQARLVSPENSNCLQAIVEVISNVMDNNPYAKLCKNMRTVELEKVEKASMENVQP